MVFTFIGMPGCGKSSMGRFISSRLNIRALDTDHLIEKNDGRRLQQIINEDGISSFLEKEEATLLSIYDNPIKHLIVSTGGSAVYSEKGMLHLASLGKIIYLKYDFETIRLRLGDFSSRGVVLKEGTTLLDLYTERCALYEKYADYTIECTGVQYGKCQGKTARLIKNCIKRLSKKS